MPGADIVYQETDKEERILEAIARYAISKFISPSNASEFLNPTQELVSLPLRPPFPYTSFCEWPCYVILKLLV